MPSSATVAIAGSNAAACTTLPDTSAVRLTVIVPATNRPATLRQCLDAIARASASPEQVIVVDDSSLKHPALARNQGARKATGDVLVFVDADVTVHPDAFVRIRHAFDTDPKLVALFGSYDDAPAVPGTVSVFRNLLHHHVHQHGAGPASTFWAGLGAMRRDTFDACGGFIEHPIEDIELGMRLAENGARIVLDPAVQGKHLKDWSLWSMLRTDLLVRGMTIRNISGLLSAATYDSVSDAALSHSCDRTESAAAFIDHRPLWSRRPHIGAPCVARYFRQQT